MFVSRLHHALVRVGVWGLGLANPNPQVRVRVRVRVS